MFKDNLVDVPSHDGGGGGGPIHNWYNMSESCICCKVSSSKDLKLLQTQDVIAIPQKCTYKWISVHSSVNKKAREI